jgi:hypothetical protein
MAAFDMLAAAIHRGAIHGVGRAHRDGMLVIVAIVRVVQVAIVQVVDVAIVLDAGMATIFVMNMGMFVVLVAVRHGKTSKEIRGDTSVEVSYVGNRLM